MTRQWTLSPRIAGKALHGQNDDALLKSEKPPAPPTPQTSAAGRPGTSGTAALPGLAILIARAQQQQTNLNQLKQQADKLDVATSRISVACGYEEELTATGASQPKGLPWIESIAVSGARKLASVYANDQSDIYQGESVGAIVHDVARAMSMGELGDRGRVMGADRQQLAAHLGAEVSG